MSTCLAAFAFAVNKSWLWSLRDELRLAAEAAALAAAHELVHDDLIRGDVSRYPDLMSRAETTARQYAAANPVRGRPIALADNPTNSATGDVALGVLSRPRAGDFVPVPSRETADENQGRVNTVVITAWQSRSRGSGVPLIFAPFVARASADLRAVAAATLDRGVRGFRMLYRPVPLAPMAILSDPTGSNPKSWETRVEGRAVPNAVGPDGIHDFEVTYATDEEYRANANAVVLGFGTADLDRAAVQLQAGMTRDDFSTWGGQFVLPDVGGLDVPAKEVGPAGDSIEIVNLASALENLRRRADVRVWPLYRQASLGQTRVSGFVAARVVAVTPPASGQPLRFTLRAAMTARPDAVTDTDLRGAAADWAENRYVCKVRPIQ